MRLHPRRRVTLRLALLAPHHVGGLMQEGTVPAVKLFLVIDIDYSDFLSYCFGVIGNGSAF